MSTGSAFGRQWMGRGHARLGIIATVVLMLSSMLSGCATGEGGSAEHPSSLHGQLTVGTLIH